VASLIVLYTAPEDPEGFDAHYRETHVPLAQQLPGSTGFRVSRIVGTPRGGEAPYHLRAEIDFPDTQTMMSALMGDEGAAVSRDAMHLTRTFGATAEIMLAERF